MAYTTINTNGGAAALNTLAANAQHLNDLTQHPAPPCPSVHRNEIQQLNAGNNLYTFRHRLNVLRYRIANVTGTLNYYRIFYNGRLVVNDEDPTTSPYTGGVDLSNPADPWPNWKGAWATGVSYYLNDTGNHDGDIVSNGGAYYVCIQGHVSNAGREPGVGASWETYWSRFDLPVVGQLYECYVMAAFADGPRELAVEYIYEAAQ